MCSRKTSEPIPIPGRAQRNEVLGDITIISQRLKNAAIYAKNELSQGKNMQSSIQIMEHKSCSIVVNELKKDGDIFLVIYKNECGGKSRILFKELKDRWRFIFFKNLYSSRIFINCKLLKLMFEECEDCVISLRSPIIGSCEYLRCKDIILNVRIHIANSQEEDVPPIPYTRIELCNEFNILQSNDILIYIINSSHNITGTIVEQNTGIRRAQHDLGGKLFWDEQEQTIISFSRSEGFASAPFYYALNDITGRIVLKPLEDVTYDGNEDQIGSTPPPSSI